MPDTHGIPIGHIQMRSVRRQHNQFVVNVPKEFARELGIQPGDYIEFTRYTDGSLRLTRHAGYVAPHDLPRRAPRANPG